MVQMKLSDYVIDFVSRLGLRHAFVVSGGASIHLLHSLNNHPAIAHVCPHHEQAGAMAADAYARVTGNIGCAIATSGPGATNMITGIAGAWFDSVPVLYLSGQVTTFRMKGDTGVRQFGFQETEILPMVEPITKYCVQLRDATEIRRELEKAVHIARTGRPGPVLVDIPDDLQRAMIEVDDLPGWVAGDVGSDTPSGSDADDLTQVISLLQQSERPVVILGWGVRLAGAAEQAAELFQRLQIPVLTSWAARDIIPADHGCFAGTFGTHGTRAGNFTMQNADMVLSIGARLSTRETGTPLGSWAREAKTVIVDIDPAELKKFPDFDKPIDHSIVADAGDFITGLADAVSLDQLPNISAWRQRVSHWQEAYPAGPAKTDLEISGAVNPYTFMRQLSDASPEGIHIFSDTGCTIAWLMQAYSPKPGQRLYHDFNNTAMGWALPAALGGSLALDNAPVICLSGDGSAMMNIQELATIAHYQTPVKTILFNNGGYAMVRQTETQWLGGVNAGTSKASGLGFPNFAALARSFGIKTFTVNRSEEVASVLADAFAHDGPTFIDVMIPESFDVVPQSRFGYPIEDADPLLPREEFLANMIVKPMPKSLEPID